MSINNWLDRKAPARNPTEFELDLSDHHEAVIRCMACDEIAVAFYPKSANPNRLQCSCGAKDSQIVRYRKFHYKQ